MGFYKFKEEDAIQFGASQNIKTFRRGDELQFRECPYCRTRTSDKNTFAINLRTGQFKCLRATCGAHGNMITLSKDFDFSLGADVDEYYHRNARQYRTIHRKEKPQPKPFAEEYLQGRGISPEITNKYYVTERNDRPGVLLFPFYDENDILQFVKYRNTDPKIVEAYGKEFSERDCKPILFGMAQCNTDISKTLVLTEGQIDSMSVAEAGIMNAVSVPNGKNAFTWVPHCWDFMSKFDTLIVFGDHEHGHITLLEEMKGRFQGVIKHVRPEDYKGFKDANELLRNFGREAVRAAVENAVMIPDGKIKPLCEVEKKDLSKLERFSSGIRSLDKVLGGFYFGQLIVLTGERGEGKSTLASQFAGMALNAGHTVFFYSGELTDWYFRAWFDQQIAGPDHVNGVVNEHGVTDYSIEANAENALTEWYSKRMHIYDNGIIDEKKGEEESLLETIEKAIRQYGCRVIFIDNLMTAIEYDGKSDIYLEQTEFTRALALMAKRYNVLVMLIAHPRKRTGANFSNDDIAGSANITNLADVVLRHSKPEKDAVANLKDAPDRELQVWKNRLTGRTEKGIFLYYDERSRRLTDSNKFDWKLEWERNFNGTETSGFDTVSDDFDGIPFD